MSTTLLANPTDLEMASPLPEVVTERPRVLLIDDDRMYGRILQREAERLGIELCVCQSLEEAQLRAHTFRPDAAILDYYLDTITGEKAARSLESATPVLLISASRPGLPHLRSHWPTNVRRFLPKTVGPRIILEAALTEHWLRRAPSRQVPETSFVRFVWPMLILTALFLVVSSFLSPVSMNPVPRAPGVIWDRLEMPQLQWSRG